MGSQEIPGVTGKFGLGIWNEAEQRLIEFRKENGLVRAQTWITVILNGLPWKWTETILSFFILHPRTAFWTLLLTMKSTPFLLRDSCPRGPRFYLFSWSSSFPSWSAASLQHYSSSGACSAAVAAQPCNFTAGSKQGREFRVKNSSEVLSSTVMKAD